MIDPHVIPVIVAAAIAITLVVSRAFAGEIVKDVYKPIKEWAIGIFKRRKKKPGDPTPLTAFPSDDSETPVKMSIAPETPPAEFHGLPGPPQPLVGRDDVRVAVLEQIRTDRCRAVSLNGLAGIGKTALALKIAEELKSEFPDAQFYFDLKGESNSPLEPKQIMEFVVSKLGTGHPIRVSEELEQAEYLNVLHGRRALLVFDNAKDTQQLHRLRPNADCLMLVTSRWPIANVEETVLLQLKPEDSADLLVRLAPRLQNDPLVKRIADVCGHLPIALRAVGSALNNNRNLNVSTFLDRIGARERVLKEIDPQFKRSTAAVFQSSYDLLPPDRQRHFRALFVFPGAFDQDAVAAIWAVDESSAEDSLTDLRAYSLIGYDPEPGYYRLHDLVRVFTGTLIETAERFTVELRHSEYYLKGLQRAESQYADGRTRGEGIDFVISEWGNIEAGQLWAAQHCGDNAVASELSWKYAHEAKNCLRIRLNWHDRIPWLRSALRGAQVLGEIEWEAKALSGLGSALQNVGEADEGIVYLKKFLRMAEDNHRDDWKNDALFGLGQSYRSLEQRDQAISYFNQRIELSHKLGKARDEGAAYSEIGHICNGLGDYELARECHLKRFKLECGSGGVDSVPYGHALHGLGVAYCNLGQFKKAMACHDKHLRISSNSERLGMHSAHWGKGEVFFRQGNLVDALDHQLASIRIAEEMQDSHGAGRSYFSSAITYHAIGNSKEAIERAKRAVTIFDAIHHADAKRVHEQLDAWEKSEG